MAKYRITSDDGRTLLVEGDSPPTEQEAEALFSSLPVGGKSWAFVRMCAITWAALQLGFTEATTAAIETACGVAILVPLQDP